MGWDLFKWRPWISYKCPRFLLIATYFDFWLNKKLLDHRLIQEDLDYKCAKIIQTKSRWKIQKNSISKCFLCWQEQVECRRECEYLLRTLTLWNNSGWRMNFKMAWSIYSSLFLLSWASAAISFALSRALSKMSPALLPAFSIALSMVGECFLKTGKMTLE